MRGLQVSCSTVVMATMLRFVLDRQRRCVHVLTRARFACSVICYILSVKDRHDGNVLLDATGALIHIDFGFFLTASPGSTLFEGKLPAPQHIRKHPSIALPTFHSSGGFERAPFKLTKDIVDALRGNLSSYFEVRKYSTRSHNVRAVQDEHRCTRLPWRKRSLQYGGGAMSFCC
jgi:hypothetical protein